MAKTKWQDDFPERAEEFLKRGHIEKELAAHLGISKATLENYKKTNLDFLNAIKRGKVSTDDEVENALLKKASGFTQTVSGKDQYYPPDTVACIFWLKNRRPGNWRDTKNIQHSGDMKIKVTLTDD